MFIFSTVSPHLTNFLVLPNPTPYLELESLSSYWHFCAFLPDFINAFLSFSIISVSCAKFWFTWFAFLPSFLAAWNLDFSFPSFLNLQHSWVLCMVYAPPCLLHRLQCFSKRTFLGTLAIDSGTRTFLPFLALVGSLLPVLPFCRRRRAQLSQVKLEANACQSAWCPSQSCCTGLATG